MACAGPPPAEFNPFVAAVAVLIVRGGHVLALRRSPAKDASPGVWEAVSGRLEPDEDPRAAAVREAFEETGLTVRVEARPWAAYTARRAGVPMLVVLYRAVSVGGTLMLSDEHDDGAWLDADGFAARSTIEPLARAVRSALAAAPPPVVDS